MYAELYPINMVGLESEHKVDDGNGVLLGMNTIDLRSQRLTPAPTDPTSQDQSNRDPHNHCQGSIRGQHGLY